MVKINEQIDLNAKRDIAQDRDLKDKISKMINSNMNFNGRRFDEL